MYLQPIDPPIIPGSRGSGLRVGATLLGAGGLFSLALKDSTSSTEMIHITFGFYIPFSLRTFNMTAMNSRSNGIVIHYLERART